MVKQNGHADKALCYVGQLDDGRDVHCLLERYAGAEEWRDQPVDLQQALHGEEIGVGRYFNGRDWVGPIELNQEHKSLFPGALGPKTWEMGTLMWFAANGSSRLFHELLEPLTDHLRDVGFVGDMAVNCIANEQGAFPLEVTPRFGWPATHVQMELTPARLGRLPDGGQVCHAVQSGREPPDPRSADLSPGRDQPARRGPGLGGRRSGCGRLRLCRYQGRAPWPRCRRHVGLRHGRDRRGRFVWNWAG